VRRAFSQQEAAKFFCKKCCRADAATPYFKKGEGLGVYTLLQVCGRLKCPLVHIVISNDVPAYVVKYVSTQVHTYVSTYLGMVGYVFKYVRTHTYIYILRYGRICSNIPT